MPHIFTLGLKGKSAQTKLHLPCSLYRKSILCNPEPVDSKLGEELYLIKFDHIFGRTKRGLQLEEQFAYFVQYSIVLGIKY